MIACSCSSAAPYLRERLTNIRLALVLETAATLGALTGVLLAGIMPAVYLYVLFALILLRRCSAVAGEHIHANLLTPC